MSLDKLLSVRLEHFFPALPVPDKAEMLRASLGALAGIAACTIVGLLAPEVPGLPLYLLAPLGASAVLVFAVPNSPLAQPWSAIVGNIVSGVVAVAILMVAPPLWAPSLAVGCAILAMFLTRSLHPPGGAVALLAALERDAVLETGFAFALVPVGVMTVSLVLAGILFNRLTGRFYPFRQPRKDPPGKEEIRLGLSNRELAGLLRRFNQSPNIGVADLARMLAAAEKEAALHRFDGVTCADVMTTPLIAVGPEVSLERIVRLFRKHELKSLPVVVEHDRLIGSISQGDVIEALVSKNLLRQPNSRRMRASDIMHAGGASAPATSPVGALLNRFSRQGVQTVLVTEGEKAVGVVTRSDIIALLLTGAEERSR
ncbi:HPP family protein [Henriciella sp.]|uniref:HPP family protein n=1 Tax=Henriciella sp. TaxID=1968823 RepID=UPI002629A6F5|nr:HPP family protein [Henriciella sp.]